MGQEILIWVSHLINLQIKLKFKLYDIARLFIEDETRNIFFLLLHPVHQSFILPSPVRPSIYAASPAHQGIKWPERSETAHRQGYIYYLGKTNGVERERAEQQENRTMEKIPDTERQTSGPKQTAAVKNRRRARY